MSSDERTDPLPHIVRSGRKTLALQVQRDGTLLVRAPRWADEARIRAFIAENEGWIASARAELARQRERNAQLPPLTMDDIQALATQAVAYIPPRVAYYARRIGVDYGRITIRNQTTRWGSCTAKGNLNFNCLLMLTPPEVIDSVVVHELCHRKEMNHSRAFYSEVLRAFPDYWQWDGWLKEHGPALLYRMMG